MSDSIAVPVVVASQARDAVEALNGLLRRHGIPAHCTWIPALQDLPEALQQINPQLLVHVVGDDGDVATVAQLRDQARMDTPLLVVRPGTDEALISADLAQGARDSVSLASPERMQAVVARELRVCRMERALAQTLRMAQDYRSQLETVLTRSNDAIAQVQEGILVGANTSWLELVGTTEADALVGQPVMDCFEEADHAALKGALAACQQGRWSDHALKVSLHTSDGGLLALELMLSPGEHEGEPCVHLIVPAQRRDEHHLAHDLAEAMHRNPHSGLLHRRPLLEALGTRIGTPPAAGARYLVAIQLDQFEQLERTHGFRAGEELVAAAATVVRTHAAPTDLAGHAGTASMLVLLERGTTRDAELWVERLLERIRQHPLKIGGKAVVVTFSAGIATVPNSGAKLDPAVADVLESLQRAVRHGGNQLSVTSRTDNDARVQAYDSVWVRHITTALQENRFRLVQQPIASLAGNSPAMSDMLVRLVDTQGKEVLPSEFMPAAERNDLLRPIDRWVLGAAVRFSRHNSCCLFVRLSRDSVEDEALLPWLGELLGASGAEPAHLCIQVTESLASRLPDKVEALGRGLGRLGVRFALEHFGTGMESAHLLRNMPLDFVKMDGSLIQGLTADELLRERVRDLVEIAVQQQVATIAERVEDANTMAVLWQLGIQHLQGYLIQAPEEVVIGAH